MPDFSGFLGALKDGLVTLGKDHAKEFADALMKDGEDFAEKTKDNLKKWGGQLASGDLSPTEFESLVKGQGDLLQMEALKQAGMAAIQVDKLKKGILDTVVSAAKKTFLPV